MLAHLLTPLACSLDLISFPQYPESWTDPKSRSTLGLYNPHHIWWYGVQHWGFYFLDPHGALGMQHPQAPDGYPEVRSATAVSGLQSMAKSSTQA